MNYIDHSFIAISTITGYVFIPAFASLFGIAIGIGSSTIGLKICSITTWIKKYKSNKRGKREIEKKRKKHYKTILLPKSKLNNIVVLFSKSLID